jgi:hypothetical protein
VLCPYNNNGLGEKRKLREAVPNPAGIIILKQAYGEKKWESGILY